MADRPTKKDEARTLQVRLEGFGQNENWPEFSFTAVDRSGKALYTTGVSAEKGLAIPGDALKASHRIAIGPRAEEGVVSDPESTLQFRPTELVELLGADGVLTIPSSYWKTWFRLTTCVTGRVRRCRPTWEWYTEKVRLFEASSVLHALQCNLPTATANLASNLAGRKRRRASLNAIREELQRATAHLTPIRPLACRSICSGTVEVYRRTCCCHREWLIADPRLPQVIRDLEDLLRLVDRPVVVPRPPLPDPPPDFTFRAPLQQLPFLKDGALDEKTLNARQDLAALRTLPPHAVADYIRARPYLWFCSCSRPVRMATGSIHPDGTFRICWREIPRLWRPNCHDRFAYVVKQVIAGVTVTIYDGLAANAWFDAGDPANLVSHDPRARTCRDNGTRDDAYVYLELIGDTEAWHLKNSLQTGWDRVAPPAFNSGLAFPSDEPASGSAPYDRNWGGTLKIYYKFSEGLKDVGAKYYRLSVTAADADGNPTGTRHNLGDGLSWEKSVGAGVTVPVSLGPVPPDPSIGGENHLYLIPYDSDADWDADQYHVYLSTNDPDWSDPAVRHLLTLEVFDASGKRLRPNGTPATGLPGVEIEAPFTYRRQFQDIGPSANVPFGALTHLFWWDNRPMFADLENLRLDGLEYHTECQYLQGLHDSEFSVGYRAYHPNPLFHESHSVWWYRGAGNTDGHWDYLTISSVNVGQPSPPAPPPGDPGVSGSNTFDQMLRTDLDASRLKCSFVVHLHASAKTFDGEVLLGSPNRSDEWAFSIEING